MPSQLLNWLSQNIPGMSNLHGLPMIVLIAVTTLTLCFVIGYAIKGVQTGWHLTRAVRRLRQLAALAGQRADGQVDPADIGRALGAEPLRHLWDEYADTLHWQQTNAADAPAASEAAQRTGRRVRATMPAEAFFTREVLVDNRLFDDFTRHLPGVLTGLGIIGTFAGLLDGLGAFDASSTATAVAGLKPLLDGVAHAFSVSALAIGCAMFVTFTSRLCLAAFYRQVETLTRTIDGLYATGAGEEYLSRLVASSEKAEGHASALKDSLVRELSSVMTALAERQMQAQRDAQQSMVDSLGDKLGEAIGSAVARSIGSTLDGQMGPKLADAIGDRLAGVMAVPMNQLSQLARAMKTAQQSQAAVAVASVAPPVPASAPAIDGKAIGAAIESVLTRGLEKLEQRLDQQLGQGVASPLRDLQQQFDRTLAGMTQAQSALQTMMQDSRDANAQVTRQLHGNLEDAMKQSVAMQTLLLDEMRGFVSHLDSTREQASSQDQARSVKLAAHTKDLVGGLSTQVEDLLKAVVAQGTNAERHIERNIDRLSEMTAKAIAGMNVGAGNLAAAAQRFETAGHAVSGVLDRSAATSAQMATTSQVLETSAKAVHAGFARYDETRKTVDSNVAALTELIAAVRQEAGLSQRMIGELDRIVDQLKLAEAQSQQYLEGVNRALVRSFEEFGGALTNQLKNTIGDTDRHLSSGVQQLNGVVQHIGLTLSRMRAN